MKNFYVYIMCSKRNGTLYAGLTSNLVARVFEHKNDVNEGFTKRYGVHMLVYYEACADAYTAIRREKQLKNLHRGEKIQLIEKMNPYWKDLYDDIAQ